MVFFSDSHDLVIVGEFKIISVEVVVGLIDILRVGVAFENIRANGNIFLLGNHHSGFFFNVSTHKLFQYVYFMLKYGSRQIMNSLFLDLTPIIIGGSIALVLIIVALVVVFIRRKPSEPKEAEKPIDDNQWLIALGEKDNIKAVTVRGSRLSVELNDDKNINRELLTELGVTSIITMSNKLILVIEKNASEIANRISNHLQ